MPSMTIIKDFITRRVKNILRRVFKRAMCNICTHQQWYDRVILYEKRTTWGYYEISNTLHFKEH